LSRRSFTALNRSGAFAISLALVLAISFAIAWPLWSFATGNRLAYTLASAAAVAVAATLWIASSLARRRREGARRLRRTDRRRAP
jgi:hypothetical protein